MFGSKDNKAILTAITGELPALEKYDECIAYYAYHANHVKLLIKQRNGIEAALREIEVRIVNQNN